MAYELGERQYLITDNDQKDLLMFSADIDLSNSVCWASCWVSWQSPVEEYKAFAHKENKSRGKEYFEIRSFFSKKRQGSFRKYIKA